MWSLSQVRIWPVKPSRAQRSSTWALAVRTANRMSRTTLCGLRRAGAETAGDPATRGRFLCPARCWRRSGLVLCLGNVPRAKGPILARPANYYGLAKYTLTWEAVPGAAGYAVLRCSGAALFNQDQEQREHRLGDYATSEVFADDPGFSAWPAGYDFSLTEDELLTDPDSYLDAWGAWADHFYPQLTDSAVQDLADRKGNEGAFQRTNKDPALSRSYTDTFDGRGQGFYVYRIRTIDAAGNLGDYSPSFPPVHIFNVNPPAQPVITKISGGQKQISIRWAAHPGDSVAGYLLYRTQDPALAGDWRSMEVIKTNPQDPSTVSFGVACRETISNSSIRCWLRGKSIIMV